MVPSKSMSSAVMVTSPPLVSTSALAAICTEALSAAASIVIAPVASTSLVAPLLEMIILPVVAVNETVPESVSTPVIESTSPTVNPSDSVKVTFPVLESIATVVTAVSASVTFTIPPATIAKLATATPPAVEVTLPPSPCKRKVDALAGVISALTTIPPVAVAAPIRKVPAVIRSNSVSSSLKVSVNAPELVPRSTPSSRSATTSGAKVAIPLVPVVTPAPIAILSAVKVTELVSPPPPVVIA